MSEVHPDPDDAPAGRKVLEVTLQGSTLVVEAGGVKTSFAVTESLALPDLQPGHTRCSACQGRGQFPVVVDWTCTECGNPVDPERSHVLVNEGRQVRHPAGICR